MDIVDVLTAHHGVLRQLLAKAEQDPAVFELAFRHLTVHHTMEEKYFYDFLEQRDTARHDAWEAVNEHHIIEMVLHDAKAFPRDHAKYPVKVESLAEYTGHHLDEEEMDIFPMARQLMSARELQALGQKFQQAKDILMVELPGVDDVPVGQAGQSSAAGLGIGRLR